MSADLAQKLEQAGLMGLVVTVFRIYYRVRQFLTGLWEAFSDAFGKIRAILEPAVHALMQAYGTLYKAIFSVLEIFGLAASSADASSYRSLGETLGTVLGVIAKVGAYLLKFVIYNLAAVITVVAWVVRAVVWLGKTIVTAFIEAGKFIYKFFLPVRLLVEALRMAARDVIIGVWDFIKGLFSAAGSFFVSAASALAAAFMDLPLVKTLAQVFGAVRGFLSGDTTFFEAGKAVLVAVGKGIWSAVTYPFEMLKKALGWLRSLLPFSDAETGPLSDLTGSGAAILKTLAKGMLGVLSLPSKVLGLALQGMLDAVRWVWNGLKSLGSVILSAVTWPFRKGSPICCSGLAHRDLSGIECLRQAHNGRSWSCRCVVLDLRLDAVRSRDRMERHRARGVKALDRYRQRRKRGLVARQHALLVDRRFRGSGLGPDQNLCRRGLGWNRQPSAGWMEPDWFAVSVVLVAAFRALRLDRRKRCLRLEPDHRHSVDGMGQHQDHGAERLGVDQGPVRGSGIGHIVRMGTNQDLRIERLRVSGVQRIRTGAGGIGF